MAELVDAYVSGAYASNGVRVRLSLPAQTKGHPTWVAFFISTKCSAGDKNRLILGQFLQTAENLEQALTLVKQKFASVICCDKQVIVFYVVFTKRLYLCFTPLHCL